MTKPTVQDLLKRINYIEADIDIQKQILYAIPSDQRAEMEKTIAGIAAKKREIEALRQQIKEMNPEEHRMIVAFEEAVSQFKKLAAGRKFVSVTGRNIGETCALSLYDGSVLECLIKACDEQGDWTIITLDGTLQQYPKMMVTEKPVRPPVH